MEVMKEGVEAEAEDPLPAALAVPEVPAAPSAGFRGEKYADSVWKPLNTSILRITVC